MPPIRSRLPSTFVSSSTDLITVCQFRKLTLLGTATLTTLLVIWATVAYVRQPVVDTAVLVFRPTFKGARYSQYPNGTPFSTTDITAPSVLQWGFDRNSLSQFLSFEQFARSVLVVPFGARASTLAIEYEAKLVEPRLTPVDRQKIEAEYFSRLEALPVEYRLLFANIEHKYRVPGVLMQKVMANILADWADEAVNTRGVALYNREVITNVFTEADQTIPDLLQRTDVLRQHILLVIDTVERLNKLLGRQTMRGGKQNLAFAEIALRLSELDRLVTMSKRQEDMSFRQGVATGLENEAMAEVQPKRDFDFYQRAIAAAEIPALRQATAEDRQTAINQLESTQKTAVDLTSDVPISSLRSQPRILIRRASCISSDRTLVLQ
jgi:hypothetical protein